MNRTGSVGAQHWWSTHVGVDSHVQEEACAKSEAAEGFKGKIVGNENKKEGQRMGRCMHKVRKMVCVANKNAK